MKRRCLFLFLLLTVGVCACARSLSLVIEPFAATIPFRYGPPTSIGFQLDTNAPGANATHTISYDIVAGDLETFQAVITYPAAFTFNGFPLPANTEAGSYAVDFDFNGTIDFTIPVRSIDGDSAYADRGPDGDFDPGLDSTLEYTNSAATASQVGLAGIATTFALFGVISLVGFREKGRWFPAAMLLVVLAASAFLACGGSSGGAGGAGAGGGGGAGAHVFTITLPNGGDGQAGTISGPFTERLLATINAGLLTNPTTPGTYTTNLMFTSIDPDTDNADDSTNEPPKVLNYCKEIGINAAGNAAPTAPALVAPADGAMNVPTNTTVQWSQSTDGNGDAVSYRALVWEGGPDNFTGCNPTAVMTNLSFAPAGLASATTYSWRVVADDGKGGVTQSAIRSFTTQ